MSESNEKPQVITEEIMSLFQQYGNEDYDGEPVTQTSHMIQCAMLAIQEGYDDEIVLGAFLHDVGHLLKNEANAKAMGGFGVVNHEGLGADYLRNKGFGERLCAVVENHVAAKRFLVATEPSYQSKLSEASWQTLQWQGGPMSEEEANTFKQHPYFDDIIKVRLWDEDAKLTDIDLLPLDHFKNMLSHYLQQNVN